MNPALLAMYLVTTLSAPAGDAVGVDHSGPPLTPRPVLFVPPMVGDMNCDGRINNFDIVPFVMYILNETAWQAMYPGCSSVNGDIDRDGTGNNFDIDPFVSCILTPPPPGSPCPLP